ncbi:hypothetical protein PAXINDRAFT_97749, partial [Paxillus involutus ATCC 200175]
FSSSRIGFCTSVSDSCRRNGQPRLATQYVLHLGITSHCPWFRLHSGLKSGALKQPTQVIWNGGETQQSKARI